MNGMSQIIHIGGRNSSNRDSSISSQINTMVLDNFINLISDMLPIQGGAFPC